MNAFNRGSRPQGHIHIGSGRSPAKPERLLACVLLLLALLPVAGLARIVMVVTQPGNVPEIGELREAARLLSDPDAKEEAGDYLQHRGWSSVTSQGGVLSEAFNIPAGSFAYVWAEGPMQMGSGFRPVPGGRMLFENASTLAKPVAPGPDVADVGPLFRDAMSLKARRGSLHAAYSISKPGIVTIDLLGLDGRKLQQWKWRESSAGSFRRELEVRSVSAKGIVIVRWRVGEARAVERMDSRAFRTR